MNYELKNCVKSRDEVPVRVDQVTCYSLRDDGMVLEVDHVSYCILSSTSSDSAQRS
jgi:hypothetical protein